MKQFTAFIKKEFYHIFRDTRSMLLLLIMPIIQIIIFGFALTNEVNNVDIVIFNPSKDQQSRVLIERLSASKYFNVVSYLNNQEEIETVLKKGEAKLVVVFSQNFGKELYHTGDAKIQLIADASDPNMATSVINYSSSIINSYEQELLIKNPNLNAIKIIPETKLLYNPQMKSSYNFVPGVMGMILMLICAMMTSISIVREKELGTMEVLLVSPLKPFFIIVAKAIPYFVLSAVNLTTILLLSIFVLGVPLSGSLFWLTIISLLFILVSLSLGLMISTLVDTQVAAMLISGMVFMMPVMILSGMMFPVENMPLLLKGVAQIIPAKWYIEAVRMLMIQGVGVEYVWKEFVVLIFMALALIGVSIKKFKYRLE